MQHKVGVVYTAVDLLDPRLVTKLISQATRNQVDEQPGLVGENFYFALVSL